jgi:maleylacetoacetate isomerase
MKQQAEFILYSYFRSSASYRVRIALGLKGIEYEYRPVHLLNNGGEQRHKQYSQLNPSGQVPTLIHNGKPLGQSMAIITYLDQIRPEPQLFPLDPYLRGLNIQACEIINSGFQPLVNLSVLQEFGSFFDVGEEKRNSWCKLWMERSLKVLENFLAPHAGDYCFGTQVTAADCFLIPHFYGVDRYGASLGNFPALTRIRASCEGLEAFRKAGPGVQPDSPAVMP